MREADRPLVVNRIVQAGLELLEEDGIHAITQTQVAKRCGIRQSHLTYYFPKATDLLLAVFSASHAKALPLDSAVHDPIGVLRAVMFDPTRMRFFLKIVAELPDDPDIRSTVADHAHTWAHTLGPFFGRTSSDPDLLIFVDMVRGRAIRHILRTEGQAPSKAELLALAARLSLRPVNRG
ncbi:MAG TPA: TetR family transcriptional regulator [Pseudorhizobium sp.]|jgi:AcrR family transcriptional regulator|nr:TetR family transcriptional regulator [Pseudorhizobium sp.]